MNGRIAVCLACALFFSHMTACAEPSPNELYRTEVKKLVRHIQSVKYDTTVIEQVTLEDESVRTKIRAALRKQSEDVLKIASDIYSIGNGLGDLTGALSIEWQDDCAYAEAVAYTFAFKFSSEAYPDRKALYYSPLLMTLQVLHNLDIGNNRIESWTQDRSDEIGLDRLTYEQWFSVRGNPQPNDAQAMLLFMTMQSLGYAGRHEEAIPLAENLIERYPEEIFGKHVSTVLQAMGTEPI